MAQRVLGRVEGISFINLTSKDVVRHPLVQKIVKAYEDYELKLSKKKTKDNSPNGRNRKKQG